MARKEPAPHKPCLASWSDEKRFRDVTLSDEDDLGGADVKQLLQIFKKFDVNGDGNISSKEMYKVLKRMDFKKFTDEVIETMISSIDDDGDRSLDFDEFVSWFLSQEASGMRKQVGMDLHETET